VVVVDTALKGCVTAAPPVVGLEAWGVPEVSEPDPAGALGALDGVSPPVAIGSPTLATGVDVVVADVSRGCALFTKTAMPTSAMSAATVTTRIGRDGRAGMKLLVQARQSL